MLSSKCNVSSLVKGESSRGMCDTLLFLIENLRRLTSIVTEDGMLKIRFSSRFKLVSEVAIGIQRAHFVSLFAEMSKTVK